MEDVINLNCFKYKNILKKLKRADGEESYTYVLKAEVPTFTSGNTNTGHKWIKPLGGPILTVGEKIENTTYIIKSIDYIQFYGFTLTLEDHDLSCDELFGVI